MRCWCLQANQIPVSKTRGLSLGSGSVSLQWLERGDTGTITCSVFSLTEGRLEVRAHHLTVFSAPVITGHSGTWRTITDNHISSQYSIPTLTLVKSEVELRCNYSARVELMSHARDNQEFEIFCSATGKPAPSIIWTAGQDLIKPGRDYQVVNNGTTSTLG